MRVFSPFVLEMLRGKHCLICFLLPATTNHTTKKANTKKKNTSHTRKTHKKAPTHTTKKNTKKHESYQKKKHQNYTIHTTKNRIHTRKKHQKKHKSYHQKNTKKNNTIHTTKKTQKKTKKGIFLFVSASVSASFLALCFGHMGWKDRKTQMYGGISCLANISFFVGSLTELLRFNICNLHFLQEVS